MPNAPKSPILGVRLPADLKAWVEQRAAQAGTSASEYVRNLIVRHRTDTDKAGG